MMRETRSPQAACGNVRAGVHDMCALARSFLRAFALGVFALIPALTLAFSPQTAHAASGNSNFENRTAGAATSSKAFPSKGGNPFGKIKPPDKTQPLYLQGDQLVYDNNSNSVIARGNVEIYYSNYILTADEVVYDQSAQTLTAVGNVVLKEPNGNIVRADRYTLTDDFRDGFVQSLSIVASDDTRIAAERATRREGNVTEFINGKFTPCKSDGGMPPLWCISAARVIHDKQAATVTYQDAQFEVFGQPIAYVPYFQHADPSVKRKTGLLPPSFGISSNNLGFYTEVPYYFALAPNYDFLFNPMITAKQGVVWQGEWRHRLANGMYTIKFSGIDQDWRDLPVPLDTSRDNRELDGWRGSIETKGKFSLGSWWNLGWDATLESDDTYRRFYKLDGVLLTDRVNEVYLEGISGRNYMGIKLYHFGGLTFQDTDSAESLVHPIIDHDYVFADPVLGGELKWTTNALSLSRDGDFLRYDANGYPIANSNVNVNQELTRAVTEVKWRRQLTDQLGITYTPFAHLRGDVYSYAGYNQATTAVDESTSFARGLAAGGATVSYPWIASDGNGSHVIEPIGQIVVRQAHVQQNQLPVEDARSLVFDDTTLFEIDKFSGYDRVETGTRANVGVQYTFTHKNGGYAKLLAGQSFHLAGENPYADPGGIDFDGRANYNPYSGLETDRSDYVLGAYLAPSNVFRFVSQSRFDQDNFALRRSDLAGQLNFGPLLAQATYTYSALDPQQRDDDQQDISGALGLQLTENWSVLGTMRYDIDNSQRLMDTFQIKYSDECFVLTATYQETFVTDPTRDLEPDRTVMLNFQFKHLGSYQYKTDALDFVFGDQQNNLKY